MLKRLKIFAIALTIGATSLFLTAYDDNDFELAKNLDIFYTLFRELNIYYVDKTESGELIKKSIDAMLQSLDPYTVYYPESDIEEYRFMTTGQYGGIGASVLFRDGNPYITEILEDSPAHKAGLKVGDVVLKINGENTYGKTDEDLSNVMKGQANTALTLEIQRPGTNGLIEKEIVRQDITIKSVPYYGMLDAKTGYLILTSFTENCSGEVREALTELIDNQKAEKIVFDLRNNPGGLLIEAVNIVNFFVDKNLEVVSTRGKVDQWNRSFKTQFNPIAREIPLAVVVNNMSASASEIVSGAIQDLDRGLVIGQRTYGKGLVQTTRPLSYNAQMKVTTAKYYIPSGRCIQAIDYSHRNPDGSVGHVPDSLIKEFKTLNGRKVFDGGGVLPDVIVNKSTTSEIANILDDKVVIFDYVTQYCLQHDSIAAPEKFEFTDADYADFVRFVENKKIQYQTKREQELEKLITTLKADRLENDAQSLIVELKKITDHNVQRDLANFKDEIKQLIAHEIVVRYHFQDGLVKYMLLHDAEIDTAINKLQATAEYNKLLGKQ